MCFSYKEASEEETGSEDLIEVEETDAVPQVIKNDAETIERVMKHRMGQRGSEMNTRSVAWLLSVFLFPIRHRQQDDTVQSTVQARLSG